MNLKNICGKVKKTQGYHMKFPYFFLLKDAHSIVPFYSIFLIYEFLGMMRMIYRTMTAPVEFIKCLKSIKEHAFSASEYPVVITLEDHLTADLQAKTAEVNL